MAPRRSTRGSSFPHPLIPALFIGRLIRTFNTLSSDATETEARIASLSSSNQAETARLAVCSSASLWSIGNRKETDSETLARPYLTGATNTEKPASAPLGVEREASSETRLTVRREVRLRGACAQAARNQPWLPQWTNDAPPRLRGGLRRATGNRQSRGCGRCGQS